MAEHKSSLDESEGSISKPDLSSYFAPDNSVVGKSSAVNPIGLQGGNPQEASESFFDQLEENSDSLLHSCRESRLDLRHMAGGPPKIAEAKIDVVEQKEHGNVQSLRRRQMSESEQQRKSSSGLEEPPSLCTIFSDTKDSTSNRSDPFADISRVEQADAEEVFKKPAAIVGAEGAAHVDNKIIPSSLDIKPSFAIEDVSTPTSTAPPSMYATPIAPTPGDLGTLFMTSTPGVPGQLQSGAAMLLHQQPITSPLPNAGGGYQAPPPPPSFNTSSSVDDSMILPDEGLVEPTSVPEKEANRRLETWIPALATAQILSSVAASNGGTFFPDRSTLTMPVVAIREDLMDPVRNLVSHYRGEAETQKRQVLTADSVTRDQKGLRQLVRAGCYRAAVNLTARLLQMYNQGTGQNGSVSKHTPSSLQIWFARISLLVKLRQFSIAEVETEPFGDLDRPDLYFQFYPDMYPNRRGSMVPFEFRILVAEIPQYLGKHHETLDRLYALLAVTNKIQSNLAEGKAEDGSNLSLNDSDREASKTLWKEREIKVLYSLANSAIIQRDFDSAIANLETLLEVESGSKSAKILSAMGRVYLQLGDVMEAESTFAKALQFRAESVEEKAEHLMDLAFLAMANADFPAALNHFKKSDEILPDNTTVINNISVCHVYCGLLKAGLDFLETKVTANPGLLLHETIILNLCTAYELESSYASQKKRAILDLVSQYKGDGINAACLKLQM